MDQLFAAIAGGVAGMLLLLALEVIYFYRNAEAAIHRIRYKQHTLPCPACRDDETDKPTGKIKPRNPWLQQELGNEEEFDCATCDGTKYITYEFPRLETPTINERQIIEGPVNSDGKAGKKRWWR